MSDIGFTEVELQILRAALVTGAVAVSALLLAFAAKVISEWLRWRQ